MNSEDIVETTARIVSAYVGSNSVQSGDVANIIAGVHSALVQSANGKTKEAPREPAVAIKNSIHPDYIVCLECGAKKRSMRFHLTQRHQVSAEEYRARWKLPSSYPMVAASFSKKRKDLAIKNRLGVRK